MKNRNTIHSNAGLKKLALISMATLFLASGSGFAQELNVVWSLQTNSYSSHLGLSKSDAKKLASAYTSFREEVATGSKQIKDDLVEEQQELAGEELITRSKEHFNQDLGKIVEEEQLAGAMLVLGSLNARWDSYVKILAGYQLSADDLAVATSEVCTYMVKYLEARAEAAKANTRFSSVTASTLKEALDAGLSKILSEEQKSDWATQTARKSRQ